MSNFIHFKGLSPIAPLGVGTWQWGDKLVWGFGKGYQESDAKEAYTVSLNTTEPSNPGRWW
jgi:hypothetical protein